MATSSMSIMILLVLLCDIGWVSNVAARKCKDGEQCSGACPKPASEKPLTPKEKELMEGMIKNSGLSTLCESKKCVVTKYDMVCGGTPDDGGGGADGGARATRAALVVNLTAILLIFISKY